jgi:fatty acid desaturase
MKIWKHSHWDFVMLVLSIAQFVMTLFLAIRWESWSTFGRVASYLILTTMTVYNVIVVSHLFTHTPWFNSTQFNRLVSMFNSVNIGQSVQAYQLTHVRNHHRYNNDRKGPDGKTKDGSSTFRDSAADEHVGVFRYAVFGAVESLFSITRALLSVTRLWRVGEHEQALLGLAAKTPTRRARELRQIQLDRMAHFMAIGLFLAISWKWFLLCYLPAFFLSLALVNIQNYYEHYGALPENTYANSVSYYGRIYNLLTFNDGYHQEHHLRPLTHWTQMPKVRQECGNKLDSVERIVSPVPALLGAFHRNRKQLHRQRAVTVISVKVSSETKYSPKPLDSKSC